MTLPGDLSVVTVTGAYLDVAGDPQSGSVSFAPCAPLTDATGQVVVTTDPVTCTLDGNGEFTSPPLTATDNTTLLPAGWFYKVVVTAGGPAQRFSCFLPSSPSTVDITALTPLATLPQVTPYITGEGGTIGGTLTLAGSPPVRFPGGGTGEVLTSDAFGNGSWAPATGGGGDVTSVNTQTGDVVLAAADVGADASGAASAAQTAAESFATSAVATETSRAETAEALALPLAGGTMSGNIAMGGSHKVTGLAAGSASGDAAAFQQLPSATNLLAIGSGGTGSGTQNFVDLTASQTIAGNKTFTGTTTTFSGTEVIVPPPVNDTDAATKAYVDASAQGLSVKLACQEATTAALPSNTYSNGTLGVGATLTATATGVLTVDGQAVALNDRVLVKNEATPANNGIYLCTTAGAAGVAYVLTRATDTDQAAEIPGAFTFVVNGTANGGSSYAVTTGGTYTIGTTAITFALFSAPVNINVTSPLSKSGPTISLGTVPIAQGGTGQTAQQAAINALAGGVTSGDYLRGDGTNVSMSALAAADLTGNVPISHGGTGAGNAAAAITALTGPQTGNSGKYLRSDGTNAALAPLAATDLTGTVPAGTLPAATTSAQGAIELGGGTTNFLRADGTWAAPPGGGASLDTAHTPAALTTGGTAGLGTNGASPSDHAHPTTGLLTTSAPVDTTHGGTGVNAASSEAALAAMAGATGVLPNGQYLRTASGAVTLSAIAATDLPAANSGTQGAVILDGTTSDIQPSPGTASASVSAGGGSPVTKPSYADHVHGSPTNFAPTGLTGATTPSRYIGAVSTSAAPTGGTYSAGDYVVDKSSTPGFWICTTGSSPGPVAWSHIVTGTGLTNPMNTVGDTLYGSTVTGGVATPARLAGNTAATPKVFTQTGTGSASAAPSWQPQSTDWINVMAAPYGADNTGVTDATTIIQSALNAAPFGGTVYLPAGTYKTTKPLIIPPAVTLQGSGRSLAYDGGSQPMTIATSVLAPALSGSFSATYGGQAVTGVLAMLGITLNGGGFFAASFSFTATSASPCVFTAAGSSYSDGDQVVLTGSVPTGFTAGTIYYAKSPSGTTFRLAATSGGTAINSTSTGSGTVKQEYGSANQTIRNLTINGSAIGAGTQVRGIEAWGPVWGVKLEDVGIYHMPDCGIFTNATASGSDTTHFPDFWQLLGVHIAGCHNHGASMTAMGDSYFIGCESTGNSATGGNFANGWTISGDNIKIVGCKAEYNTGIGLVISRGNAARPILVNGFGTDGNGHGGIQITGTGGAGPVVLSGVGLNYDGQNNGAGGNFAALSITGGAHVTATGLHVTTGIAGASHLYPQYGVQCPSTFTGVLQIENSEIYGGTAAVNLDATATGVVRYGPNVLTGSGDWSAQSLANIVQAPSPQTGLQQYAKYWSASAGAGGNWVTPTAQQPRESVPWYAALSNVSITAGVMLCAVIPVMPGDVISKLGFVIGSVGATFGTTAGTQHWWTALYTADGSTKIAQSADQTNTVLPQPSSHLLALGTGAPYTVPAGTYALLGAVMINTGTGGTPVQPTLRGGANNGVQNGGASDLFSSSLLYAATNSTGLGATAPAAPLTLAATGNLAYLGAC